MRVFGVARGAARRQGGDVRLIVDVSRADPVAGSVRTADGAERDFTTWLGLLSVLRDVVGDDSEDHGEEGEQA